MIANAYTDRAAARIVKLEDDLAAAEQERDEARAATLDALRQAVDADDQRNAALALLRRAQTYIDIVGGYVLPVHDLKARFALLAEIDKLLPPEPKP